MRLYKSMLLSSHTMDRAGKAWKGNGIYFVQNVKCTNNFLHVALNHSTHSLHITMRHRKLLGISVENDDKRFQVWVVRSSKELKKKWITFRLVLQVLECQSRYILYVSNLTSKLCNYKNQLKKKTRVRSWTGPALDRPLWPQSSEGQGQVHRKKPWTWPRPDFRQSRYHRDSVDIW